MPFKVTQETHITGIATSQRTDQDINDLILKHMNKVPGLTRGFVTKLVNARRRLIRERLQTEPGPPQYPIRWKSERQRRFVMWLLRTLGNLPYVRTHALSQAWIVRVLFNQKDRGGTVELSNPAEAAPFVYGPHQQPYHEYRWENYRDVAADEANALEEDLASAYVTLADPYAGIRSESLY